MLAFLLGLVLSAAPPAPEASAVPDPPVLVIAHRGASAYRPEHTLEAYRLAVEMGADVIEPDLVITRDGTLIARHENEIGETTNVADRPEFASRRTVKTIDGQPVEGWFAEDFTLAEVKTLRARERLPALRPQSAAYDGRFEVPTLDEILALAARLGAARGRPVGVYPETKHPAYFAALGLGLEEPLVAALHGAGFDGPKAPVWIQSFETESLRRLRGLTQLRLVQLAYPGGRPWDLASRGDSLTYDRMMTPEGLAGVARYADAVGVHTAFVLPILPEGVLGPPTRLVADARALGLDVHAWTVRAENAFLPPALRSPEGGPSAQGDVAAFVRALAEAGVAGLFTDHPDLTLRALGR